MSDTAAGLLTVLALVVVLGATHVPLGDYMARVYSAAKHGRAERLAAVRARVRMVRYGGDCYGYCLLAAGFVDLIIEAGLKPYDVAPLVPIIEAAGGMVTTWDGGPASGGGRIVASGDPRVHEQALRILSRS